MERKSRIPGLTGLIVLASLSLSACGSDASGPPAITLDETACAHCGMLVSDLAFAAAYRTSDGEAKVFDDIGCLLEEIPSSGAKVFVHDFESAEWLDGDAAFYLRSESIETPMGGGIIAFRSREQAEKRGGEVLRLADLKGNSR